MTRGEDALAAIPFVLLLDAPLAASSTRKGGVSAGPLGALNLGFRASDRPDRVRENRLRFAGALGLAARDFVCARQVHGGRAVTVGASDRGRGAVDPTTAVSGCDALVTAEANVPLLVLSADCAVVAVADRRRSAIALAHAGWRGLLRGVIGNTVGEMAERHGARREDLVAAISPCIGPCCYEVGDDLVSLGRGAVPGFDAFLSPGPAGRAHLDIPGLARALLEREGLDGNAISGPAACTRCRADEFHSHRASGGARGLLGTAAVIANPP